MGQEKEAKPTLVGSLKMNSILSWFILEEEFFQWQTVAPILMVLNCKNIFHIIILFIVS
jgi:hypothetical protein